VVNLHRPSSPASGRVTSGVSCPRVSASPLLFGWRSEKLTKDKWGTRGLGFVSEQYDSDHCSCSGFSVGGPSWQTPTLLYSTIKLPFYRSLFGCHALTQEKLFRNWNLWIMSLETSMGRLCGSGPLGEHFSCRYDPAIYALISTS
jgi:hypothetical protein